MLLGTHNMGGEVKRAKDEKVNKKIAGKGQIGGKKCSSTLV
jgi:hypothetical protein